MNMTNKIEFTDSAKKEIERIVLEKGEKSKVILYEMPEDRSIDIDDKFDLSPRISTHLDRKEALQGADFVQTTFQVGGYDPSTIIDSPPSAS